MPQVPPTEHTKQRRDKLPAAGLSEKKRLGAGYFRRAPRAGVMAQGRAAIAHGPDDLDGQVIYDPPLPTAAEIADKTKNPPPRPTTKR